MYYIDSTAQHSTAQHSRCLCIQNYIKLTCIKRPYDRTVVVPNKKGERKISQVKINQTQLYVLLYTELYILVCKMDSTPTHRK